MLLVVITENGNIVVINDNYFIEIKWQKNNRIEMKNKSDTIKREDKTRVKRAIANRLE